jgi:hypothetical protein
MSYIAHFDNSIVRFFCQYNIPYSAADSDSFIGLMKSSGKNAENRTAQSFFQFF